MRAAVANGADAVYFGLNRFNARHRAHNFTVDELPRVIDYLRRHNVRGYVAFNTLIFSDELPDAQAFIVAIARAGVDAVIVQDLGLARLISRIAPDLAIHGSTQMTLTEPRGIEFVHGLGVSRVIVARELSLTDIRRIKSQTQVPLETFVHGALCVSYSGQCLTSEAIGRRSANRGQCAQACRLPYDLVVDGNVHDLGDKAYLLSPQDLAAHDLVDELAEAGVCSLKIEGRLKNAAYVAATTQTYRAAIDALATATPFAATREQQLDLAQTFSRGFSHGFLDGVNHQELVHARFPKSRGVRVGRVISTRGQSILVEAEASPRVEGFAASGELRVGDGVVFDSGRPDQNEPGGRVAWVRPVKGKGRVTEIQLERGPDAAVIPGSLVWKTDDPAMRRRLESSYSRDLTPRRVPLVATVYAAAGEPLRVRVEDDADHAVEVRSDQPLELARKHALSAETFTEQFGRLGDTPFELKTVRGLETPAPVMAPKSVLNDMRRRAVEQLDIARRSTRQGIHDDTALDAFRAQVAKRAEAPPSAPKLHVLVRTFEQLSAVLSLHAADRPATVCCDFEDIRQYKAAVGRARASGMPIGLATLRIIKPNEEGLLRQVVDAEPDFVLIRNLAGLGFFREQAPAMPLVGDYALNVSNELTADLFASHGVGRMVPSYDLSWSELKAMMGRFPAGMFEAVVHQHMPMFHMEHCVFAHVLSDGTDYRTCGRPCEKHQVDLRDRAGAANPLIPDVGCRNTVFNGVAQSAAEFIPRMRELGIGHFRVELLRQSADETLWLLERYRRAVRGEEEPRQTWRQLKVLNQLGVTRGTLEG